MTLHLTLKTTKQFNKNLISDATPLTKLMIYFIQNTGTIVIFSSILKNLLY